MHTDNKVIYQYIEGDVFSLFALINVIRKDLRIKDFNRIMSGKLQENLCSGLEWTTLNNKSIDQINKEITEFTKKLKSKLKSKLN